MRIGALLVLTVGFLLAADVPKDDAATKELDKLQGTWALVSAERDGKKLAEAEVKKTKITFEGDRFVFPNASGIGTSQKGIIKVYPSKTPKWMDSPRLLQPLAEHCLARRFGHATAQRQSHCSVLPVTHPFR